MWPDALQEVVDLFAESPAQDRLELLLEFAMSLPDLPPELEGARDQMEQVHECQSPAFIRGRLEHGRVYYDIDVPKEAPTVRGFASILHHGLNGATPEEVAATPLDLYERLGLHQLLSPQRLRGLTALLGRMKRNAAELSATQ